MSEAAHKLVDSLPVATEGPVPAWLAELRERGAGQFRVNGLPDKQVEQWKYSSLFGLEQLDPLVGKVDADIEPATDMQPLAGLETRVSMVDGMFSALHGTPVEGCRIFPLHDVLNGQHRGLRSVLEELVTDTRNLGFSALNTAALGAGLLIEVEGGVDAGELLIQWHQANEQAGKLFNSRVVVLLGEGARLQLVEQYENEPGQASILNMVMQFRLAEGAELSLTRYQQQSESSYLVTRTDGSQSANSSFHFTGLDLGDGFARHDVKAALMGPGAKCALNGACMGRGQSHADHHLEAAHIAHDCQSSQLFRSVADDRSRVVFNGKVYVAEGADGTDAEQSSAGLLLSKLAEIDAKPELEIYADEVIASHGATVGQLDEEALFYLRSRGVGRDDARNILTMAFSRSVTDCLPVAALREPLGERLTRRLEGSSGNG